MAQNVRAAWIGAGAAVIAAVITGFVTWSTATGSGHVGELNSKIQELQRMLADSNTTIQVCKDKLASAKTSLTDTKRDLNSCRNQVAAHVNAIEALENTKLIQVYDSSRQRSGFQETKGNIEDTFQCVVDRFAKQWNSQYEPLKNVGTTIKKLTFGGINHEKSCP